MKAAAPQEQALDAPLPLRQFKRFVYVFHAVFIVGIIFSLLLRFRRPHLGWSFQDTSLLGLALMQIALYVLFMIRQWKPVTATAWWLAYFLCGSAIWLAEWRLEPMLQWTIWAYLGQAFGVLRPVMSVPFALAAFATWLAINTGYRGIREMNGWQWFGTCSLALSFTVFGVFFYRLAVTSTERAKLIAKLEAAQRELEKSRERDAELAALRERERLAREMHDSLGHGLVTLTVQLEAAQRLYPVDPGRASALMDEMKQLTRSSMEQLRRALAGLRAPGLGDRALIAAVRNLCGDVSGRGAIKADCELPEDVNGLSPAVTEALWRVAQEGLANVEKHAQAHRASIRLALEPAEARLVVTDDGTGIASGAESKPGHYGLRGLRERVEGLGGTLVVNGGGPRGTTLKATIPLPI